MEEAIFMPQSVFKIAGKGLVISGILKSGILKPGMIVEIKGQKITLIGIEAFNKELEEVKDKDSFAKSLAIVLPETAEKFLVVSKNREIIFKELK